MLDLKKYTRSILSSFILSVFIGFSATSAMADNMSTVPLYTVSKVDPNILINLSVETPMGGAAYNDQYDIDKGGNCNGRTIAWDVGNCYTPTNVYLGYFDPDKCYDYSSGRFNPQSDTVDAGKHTCSGRYSGNFMNWATMTAMDAFVFTMTGGNRVVDTDSLTVVERAKKHNNSSWFPHKYFTTTDGVSPSMVTPYSNSAIYIRNDAWAVDFGTTKDSQDIDADFNVQIRVCDETKTLEDNCVAFTDGGSTYYKPVGLIQKNAKHKRFGVVSYLKANTIAKNGGVLRSKMKYVGLDMPETSGFGNRVTNTNAEWGSDGLYIDDPDSQAGSHGIVYSGVINYINKFTREHGHKVYDPVSELFYEAVHYFRGQDNANAGPTGEYLPTTDDEYGHFPAHSTWDDPIEYACQKNFIIAINDSFPHRDKRVPGSNFTCPFTGDNADDTDVDSQDCGQPSDADTFFDAGTWTSSIHTQEGGGDIALDMAWANGAFGPLSNGRYNSNYIAGLAYQANVTDLRDDFTGDQTITTFMVDTQEYNNDPLDDNKSPLWLTAKYGGFVDENGNDQPDLQSEWDADANGDPDNYVLATKPAKMIAALNNAFRDIDALNSSSSAVVANSVRLVTGTQIYQAGFDSGDWSGDLIALPVAMDGSIGAEVWSSKTQLQSQGWSSGRNIFTSDPDTGNGKVFTWNSITSDQQDALDINPTTNADDGNGEDRLEYIRGNGAKEISETNGIFRDRDYKLGDLINSTPVYVADPQFDYPDSLVDIAGGEESYGVFAQAKSSRTPVIYVGGNDGMLHGFDAANGNELMAYVPGFILPELNEFTSPFYEHRYYVDGSPTMGDVLFSADEKWHTVLASGARSGGQGVFLLDITDPTAFTQTADNATKLAVWEFTDEDDSDLGYTFSQPSIGKMADENWAVVFGNGYHNTEADGHVGSGHAVLYIVNAETGALIKKIDTGVGDASNPNGLSTPSLVDIDGDNIIDYIYAGDLYGNMWKFKVTHTNTAQWTVDYKLFAAADGEATPNPQPITVKPDVGFHPLGGYMVYFGTGKYFEEGDGVPTNYGTQTFYGVRDNGSAVASRATLQEQEVRTYVNAAGGDYRITTNNTIDWDTQDGWYMDLTENGELVVQDPQLNQDNIVFVTQTPVSDPCAFGGTSWVMELDAITGGWPDGSVFDTNNDGVIDDSDLIDYDDDQNVATGWRPGDTDDQAIYTRPTIIPAGEVEYKFMSKSSGGVATVKEKGAEDAGRQSWEQIR